MKSGSRCGDKIDAATHDGNNACINYPTPSPQLREAIHSREGIPDGSETMSSVAFPCVAIR